MRLASGRPAPEPNPFLKLTGKPSANTAEEMVKKIAGKRLELPLAWLEKKVCHELYVEELRLTRYAADIGLCGRELFHKEASILLAGIRPEFGYICKTRTEANAGAEEPT
jgi:hypothetical protein